MRLDSLDGTFVDLTIVGYQFAAGRSTGDNVDWDANWLVVHGKVWDGLRSWEFHDPCMTTWEARELAGWLRGLGNSHAKTVADAEPDELRLWFTEPNLMFALDATSQGITEFSVYFDAEARPSLVDDSDDLGPRVRLRIPQAEIATAVDAWERHLLDFPVR